MNSKKRNIELVFSLISMIFGVVILILNFIFNKFDMFEFGVTLSLVGLIYYVIKDGITDRIIENIKKTENIKKENATLKKQLNENFFTYIDGKGSINDSELLSIFDSMSKENKKLFMNDLKKYMQ